MARCNGIYPGICVSNQDPARKSRLQVKVPALADDPTEWARACVAPPGNAALPSVGDMLWVMFEGGKADHPVWLRYEQRVAGTGTCFGIYAAICLNTEDPEGKTRVQVRVPAFSVDSTTWARSGSGTTLLPSVGDTVWVIFEGGDPEYQLWLGMEP